MLVFERLGYGGSAGRKKVDSSCIHILELCLVAYLAELIALH
jgi:hypothetical protein